MTRFLSESLQAPEPFFRQGLRRLESAHGNPSTDIRFTTEVSHATRQKLQSLGLDPKDTSAQELYHALQERIKEDDARLYKALQKEAMLYVSLEADVVAGMIHALKELPDSKRCFALKSSKLKALLKAHAPKKAMKQLGYRSIDSFLKHEVPVLALSAAWLVEGAHWQERFVANYKSLKSSDFENRNIMIIKPDSLKWERLANSVVDSRHHNLLSFKEIGALVFLPLPREIPAGTVTASLTLALHELNEIRASSTFLQLCQVRKGFGSIVQTVVNDEPRLSSELLDQPVPWNLIQRFYSETQKHLKSEVFEPHIQLEDIAWHPIEKTLSAIDPDLDFWHQSAHLGLLKDKRPVSLNIVDAALNYCNQLPFEQRIVHYFQRSLWHELLLRYLHPDSVEKLINNELQPELAAETLRA